MPPGIWWGLGILALMAILLSLLVGSGIRQATKKQG